MITTMARTTAIALVAAVTALGLAGTAQSASAPAPTSNSSSTYRNPSVPGPYRHYQHYDACAVLTTAVVVGEPTGETQTIHLARELSNVSGSESI